MVAIVIVKANGSYLTVPRLRAAGKNCSAAEQARRQPTAAAALRLLKSADCCVASPSVEDTPPRKTTEALLID